MGQGGGQEGREGKLGQPTYSTPHSCVTSGNNTVISWGHTEGLLEYNVLSLQAQVSGITMKRCLNRPLHTRTAQQSEFYS